MLAKVLGDNNSHTLLMELEIIESFCRAIWLYIYIYIYIYKYNVSDK